MEKTYLESEENEAIFGSFLNEPDIARHRIIINSNYYSAIYCSKYWFHSPHFSLKFCARHSCTSVLQKCSKTCIVCVSCIILPAVSCLEIKWCGKVNLQLLGAAFPGVTDLKMTAAHWWRAVQEEVGTSSLACRRWSCMKWKDCRCCSVQSYHQVNGDDLDASKVSNSRCVRADAALSLRPIRHPFAASFLAKRILCDFIVMDCGCKVG